MPTLYRLPLLSPDSSEDFQCIDLTADSSSSHDWSLSSYVLRGGLQEGVQVVEVDNGKLSFSVLPTRGMGIWKGTCGDVQLGWDSPVKDPVNPAFINLQDRNGLGWLKGFNEWFVRCGLNSVGAPGLDTVLDNSGNECEVPLTLHGNIANLPARRVSIEIDEKAIIIRGEVDETMMFGPAFRLNTEIRTELGSGSMTITDTVTNLGDRPQEHEMLYHINYGEPLLGEGSRMIAPFKQVAPRDSRSSEDIDCFEGFGGAQPEFVEQVYFYELATKQESSETLAMLRNAEGDRASLLRFRLSDFPCFTLWKNTAGKADGYVTGLEPGTNYPNLRGYERKHGRIITLAGGESRTTRITIETLDTKDAVSMAEREINTLQKSVIAKRHPEPVRYLSDC